MELFYRSILPDQNSYPLLVLMHGLGSNEEDLLSLQPLLNPQWGVVSIRAPHAYGPGYAWFGVQAPRSPELGDLLSSTTAVSAWLDEVPERFPEADSDRVVLGGFSQGGVMSLAVSYATEAGTHLAGTCVLSGYLPEHLALQPGPPHLFWGHGTQDAVLPIALAVKAVEALQPYAADVQFRQYPLTHEVGEQELQDLNYWLAAR